MPKINMPNEKSIRILIVVAGIIVLGIFAVPIKNVVSNAIENERLWREQPWVYIRSTKVTITDKRSEVYVWYTTSKDSNDNTVITPHFSTHYWVYFDDGRRYDNSGWYHRYNVGDTRETKFYEKYRNNKTRSTWEYEWHSGIFIYNMDVI